MSPGMREAYVTVVYEQVRDWVGRDAYRDEAAAALDLWRLRDGLTDELRDRVLARFNRRRDEVPGLDYLPVSGAAQLILDRALPGRGSN